MVTSDPQLPKAAYQLGDPIRSYHAVGKPPQGNEFAIVWAGIATFIFFGLAYNAGTTVLQVVLGLAILACLAFIGRAVVKQIRAPYPHLLFTAEGLVHVEGEMITALRWDEIEGITTYQTDHYFSNKHTVTRHDVTVRSFTKNTYIRPVGFIDMIEIKDTLVQKVLPQITPRILQQLEAGEALPFSHSKDLMISRENIQYGNNVIAWQDVKGIGLTQMQQAFEGSTQITQHVILQLGSDQMSLGPLMTIVNYPVLETIVAQYGGRS